MSTSEFACTPSKHCLATYLPDPSLSTFSSKPPTSLTQINSLPSLSLLRSSDNNNIDSVFTRQIETTSYQSSLQFLRDIPRVIPPLPSLPSCILAHRTWVQMDCRRQVTPFTCATKQLKPWDYQFMSNLALWNIC